MTSDPLDQATRLLRNAVGAPDDVDALPPDRDVAIARIADALRARAQARRRKRLLTSLALAAAAVLVVGGGFFAAHRANSGGASTREARGSQAPRDLGRVEAPSDAVTALREGKTEALGQGARVAEGTELRTTGASEAHLDFDSGTRVTLGGTTRVRLVEQSQRKRFALESGSFFAKVAKLGPEERFVVATPDAEVEVRGTAFRVSIVAPDPSCAGGTPTRLDVTEGVVVVRHGGSEVRVAAGERWPACDAPTAAVPVVPAATNAHPVASIATATAPTTASTVQHGGSAATSPQAAAEASSRLAEQNDLFDDAMRLKRSGDAAGAQAKLERLLAAYPHGPLSESAEVERMRLLGASNRPRAAAAAREYLRRHPRGFGRAEAEALAAGTP